MLAVAWIFNPRVGVRIENPYYTLVNPRMDCLFCEKKNCFESPWMDPQDAIDLSREAIRTCIMVGGPILVASLVIGLLVSVLQAMTQLHDQTISFVPKILLLLVALAACLPWLTDQMLDFTKYSLEKPLFMNARTNPVGHDADQGRAGELLAATTVSAPNYRWATEDLAGAAAANFTQAESVLTNGSLVNRQSVIPVMKSPTVTSQPQLRPNHSLQPRAASPFSLPTFRSANSDAQNGLGSANQSADLIPEKVY
jgi:flagellar biosynthetic protein FliQ